MPDLCFGVNKKLHKKIGIEAVRMLLQNLIKTPEMA
jgi:hypothetical protein